MKYYNLITGILVALIASVYVGFQFKVPNSDLEVLMIQTSMSRDEAIQYWKNSGDFFSLWKFDFNYQMAFGVFAVILLLFMLLKPISRISRKQFLSFIQD